MMLGPDPAGKHAAQPDGHRLGHEVPALPGHCAQVTPPPAITTHNAAQLHESNRWWVFGNVSFESGVHEQAHHMLKQR